MIIDDFISVSGYPFDKYFENVNQYINVQQYWLRVLRSARGFVEENWKPVEKPVDIKDDMYIGLLVDIENISEKKYIKIHAISISGKVNFILHERSSTLVAVREFGEEFDASEEDFPHLHITEEDAQKESEAHFKKTNGFEAGVDKKDFFVEELEESPDGPYVYGEEFSIVSSVSPENEKKALKALDIFLQEGSAMDRVNRVFVADD